MGSKSVKGLVKRETGLGHSIKGGAPGRDFERKKEEGVIEKNLGNAGKIGENRGTEKS